MSEASSTNKMLGEFYTPSRVVKSFHSLIADTLGENFYDEYVVWDPAWGTGNLTNGYSFKELYCSTLREFDLRKSRNVSRDAEKFQYDFLNDDVSQLISIQNRLTEPYKMPEGILEAINNNKKILFLMNPPYAGVGNFGAFDNGSKSGATVSGIKEMMTNDKMGSASDNLYSQFMYRIISMKKAYNLDNIAIAIICPPQYLTVNSYEQFRSEYLSNFKFEQAKLIRADEFDGLCKDWGISLSVWTSGETHQNDRNRFVHKCISYDDKDNEVFVTNKSIYNTDGLERACDWARDLSKQTAREYLPVFTSGCKMKDRSLTGLTDALAYMGNKSNNVQHNEKEVLIVSGCYSDGCGIPVTKESFDGIIMYYTARKLFTRQYQGWINDKDEYIKPLIESTDPEVQKALEILKTDGLVFTIFNQSGHTSSMKNSYYIDANGGKVTKRCVNNMFWATKDYVLGLADGKISDSDFETDTERYAALKLKEYYNNGLLSEKAIAVLKMASDIYRETFSLRDKFHNEVDSSFEVINWDAGWYQIRQIVKQYDMDRFKEFNACYKELWDYLQQTECVYKSGMLIK